MTTKRKPRTWHGWAVVWKTWTKPQRFGMDVGQTREIALRFCDDSRASGGDELVRVLITEVLPRKGVKS